MQTIPYVMLLAAFMLIYLPRIFVVGRAMARLEGGYNNRDPRAQQAHLDGVARRALGAHLNGFEAFAPFAAATLAAIQRGAAVELVGWLAIAFVAIRTGYVVAYLADRSSLRSTLWGLGMCTIGGLLIAAIAG